MSDFSLQNQIIVLELLRHAGQSLSNGEITDFLTGSGHMHYFTAQETIASLVDAGMLAEENTRTLTLYHLNESAENALRSYQDRIDETLRTSILNYLTENNIAIRQTHALQANYEPLPDGSFLCHLKDSDDGRVLMDLTFAIPTEAAAQTICMNWVEKYQDVYQRIVDGLI